MEKGVAGCLDSIRLNGHESEKTLRNSEAQGSLACYIPWHSMGSQGVGHVLVNEQQQKLLLFKDMYNGR